MSHLRDKAIKLTLQAAADFVRTSRGPALLLRIIKRFSSIFDFNVERQNRISRYVKITRAYARGKSVRDIESEFGCSKHTVLRYARMAELPRRQRGFDPEIRKKAIALYNQERPIAEIAALLGVSQAYVSKLATKEGINRRKFRRKQD